MILFVFLLCCVVCLFFKSDTIRVIILYVPSIGKFLPMKTMLGPRYDDQVPEENRFHPGMLSNFLKSLKVSNYVKTWFLSDILK